jgi:hypothetical protein
VIRVPLGRDSAKLVAQSVERAEELATAIRRTLRAAIDASRHTMEKLKAEGRVEPTDLAPVIHRIDSLQQLLADLNGAATSDPITCHPTTLVRWFEILGEGFTQGNPAADVRVVVTYVL